MVPCQSGLHAVDRLLQICPCRAKVEPHEIAAFRTKRDALIQTNARLAQEEFVGGLVQPKLTAIHPGEESRFGYVPTHAA